MTPNELLLAAIKARQVKQTSFGRGVLTADQYVKTIPECIGSDACYKFAATRSMSFADVLTKATKTLTYNNDDMIIEDLYGKNYEWKDEDGDELELPKNTLMVFKHVLTTPRKDRDGDIMRTSGAKLDPKMLMLWQHVHTLPIGKLLTVAEHNAKRLSVVSALVDMNDLAHDSAVMIDNGMGRFSHGFRALEFTKIKEHQHEEGGFDVKSFEIMEESLVSVPSNTDADTLEVLLSLVEGGKLTSPMMKAVGKSIRMKTPKSEAVGIDVARLPLALDLTLTVNGKAITNGEKKSDETKGTKCSGDADCGCGCKTGASEKADDVDDTGEKGSDDKEMMMCPKCGGKLAGGVCEKCGYEAKAADVDEEKSGKPAGTKDSITLDQIKMSSAYVSQGSLDGSYEAVRAFIEPQVIKFLEGNGISLKNADNPGSDTFVPYAYIVGTYPDYTIASVSTYGGGYRYYKLQWKASKDGPVLVGTPVEVQINTSTTVMEKMVKGMQRDAVKRGRAVSASNLGRLGEAHDAVSVVHDTEHLMSKGGKSLCREAIGHIKAVMDTSAPKEEASADKITIEKAVAIVAAKAMDDTALRIKLLEALTALNAVDEMQSDTDAFLALTGATE